MNQTLITQILQHDLHYDEDLDDIAKMIAITGAAKDEEGGRYEAASKKFLLKTWYDGYLFCLQIGLEKNQKRDAKNKSIKVTRGWAKRRRPYLTLIAVMLEKTEVQEELGLNDRKSLKQYVGEEGIKQLSKKIKILCDQYAFGGLEYLKELYNKDPDILNGAVMKIDKMKLDED